MVNARGEMAEPFDPRVGWPPESIPQFAWSAARFLYAAMVSIDGEAMNRGQVEQDCQAEMDEWTRLVASVIATEFRKHQGETRGD
jgi:hypothetical protein